MTMVLSGLVRRTCTDGLDIPRTMFLIGVPDRKWLLEAVAKIIVGVQPEAALSCPERPLLAMESRHQIRMRLFP